MLISKENFNSIFYIHIPRTGGRYIRELFIKNNYSINFINFNERLNGKEVPHLHYPFYNNFCNDGKLNQFTIVRNPIDRFISLLMASSKKDNFELNLEKISENENVFFNFINNQIMFTNYHSNWFLPQFYFTNPNCKIWKFENGLNKEFFNWLKNLFNVDIVIKKINYEKDHYDNYEKIKLNENLINFVKKYYQYDFKLFNY